MGYPSIGACARYYRLFLFTSVATMSLIGVSVAHANEPTDPNTSANVVSDSDTAEIIVRATRKSASEAVRIEQKNARGVTSIISGEELRDQPQANLADLLIRLPGLSSSSDMSRLQAGTGEAQYVSIRGLDTAYNAFSFDGVRLPQTDANTRAISMNLLSPFGLSRVRVEKAPTARQDGDAIAGLVDFRTATAFDFGRDTFQVRTSAQSSELAEKAGQDHLGYAVQIEGSRLSRDRRFGVYLSAYYAEKDQDGQSTAMQSDWEKYNNNIAGTVRDNEDNLIGRGVQWNFFRNHIERSGLTANFDFRGENHDFYWYNTAARYKIQSNLDQSSIRVELPSAAGQINPNGGAYDSNGLRVDYGIMAGGYHRSEDSTQTLFTSKLGGRTRLERLTLDYHVAFNRGRQDYPNRIQSAFYGLPYIGTAGQTGVAQAFMQVSTTDPENPRVILTPEAAAYFADPDTTRQWYVSGSFDKAWERKAEAAFDAEWAVDKGYLSTLTGGFKYETSKRFKNTVDGDANRYRFAGNGYAANSAPFFNPQGISYASFPGETLTSFNGADPQVPIRLLDIDYLNAQVREFAYAQGWSDLELKRNRVNGKEKRAGYFIEGELNFGDFQLVPGLRFEDNSFEATYWQSSKVGTTDTSDFVTSKRDYDQWLPSLVGSWRPDDRTVYRAVVRKSYSRPSFDLLFGPTTISYDTDGVTQLSVYVPNPDLEPVESVNLDLSAEYYLNRTDYFTATVFHKSLDNVIFATGTTNAGGNHNIANAPAEIVDGVTINSLDNSGDGKVLGIEFAGKYALRGLPGVLDGLILSGNLTLQDARSKITYGGERRKLMMPNAPKVMYNIEAAYYRDGLTMVLNYNRTGQRLISIRSDRSDIYSQPTQNMNFISSYQFRNNVSVGVSVINLLDDHSYWATTGKSESYLTHDRNGGYVEAGRTFMVNLSYRR